MSTADLVVIVLTVALVVVLLALFVVRNTPGRGNSSQQPVDATESARLYARSDRPAGPDAEDMYVVAPGQIAPNPPSGVPDDRRQDIPGDTVVTGDRLRADHGRADRGGRA